MKLSRLFTIITFFFVNAFDVFAQDIQLLQFYASPVQTNPALTGAIDSFKTRGVVNYRNQHPQIMGSSETYNASFDGPVNQLGTAISLFATWESGAEEQLLTYNYGLTGAQEISISEKLKLRVGAGITYKEVGVNFHLRCFDDCFPERSTRGMILPTSEPLMRTKTSAFVLNSGALLFTKNAYLGFAIHNVNTPNLSFYKTENRVQRRSTLHAGYEFKLPGWKKSNSCFSVNTLLMQQGDFEQVNLGFQVVRGVWDATFWMRDAKSPYGDFKSALVGVGFVLKGNMRWAVSYDATTWEEMQNRQIGSIELSLNYKISTYTSGKNASKLPTVLYR